MSLAKPNVIMIITDDQGYGDLACHGNPVAQTPNLDQLYAESIRLVDFHAAPMCTPTRGQLLTGLDAARNGAVNVSSGRTLLRANLATMADVFKAGGYRTGMFGKWHLGDNYPYRPQDRGFEESLWFPSSHISSLPDYWENDYFDDVYWHNGTREHHTGYCTQVFFSKARAWIQERVEDDEPFFTYLPTNAPHYPLFVPKEDREALEKVFAANADLFPDMPDAHKENLIRFLAMIRNLDTEIGGLRAFIEGLGIADNTILIFMTDNGSTFGPTYYNAGMRGAKVSLWEGGHRVPCFIHWPEGNLGDPRDIDGLTEVQDMLPTLMDLCGLDAASLPEGDGISLAGTLRDKQTIPEDRILAVNYSRMPSFDYPSPDAESFIRREGAAVLWKRWRLLEGTALYNLDDDPHQDTNVITQHPDIAEKLTQALDAWWTDVEPVANEIQYVIIGSDAENPTMLTACEWKDVFVDQQFQVRVGQRKNSYWHLDVERAGTYQFELCRWPKESGLRLRDGCDATQVTDGWYAEGVALPIARARMMIARKQYKQDLASDAFAATFNVDLDAGPTLLHTWFDDERQQSLGGAYYVYVTRLD